MNENLYVFVWFTMEVMARMKQEKKTSLFVSGGLSNLLRFAIVRKLAEQLQRVYNFFLAAQ